MCYTPTISLATAILEFAIAGYIFFRYRLTTYTKFIIPFIFLLGLYQLSEFMLCLTGHSRLWVTAGLIIYTFLPPIALHFVIRYTRIKLPYWQLIYVLPITFSLIALLINNFVIAGSCSSVFILAQTLFSQSVTMPLTAIYWFYYFGYIMLTVILLLGARKRTISKIKKRIYLIGVLSILITLLPPLILVIILPSLGLKFPSIYCQFALLFAVVALIGAASDERVNKINSEK